MSKTIRKILAISMCAALVGSTAMTMPVLVPDSTITASAVETNGDYQYETSSDGTVKITKYTGTATTLILPSYLDGKKVTSIEAYAFNGCTIVNLTIPSTFTSIPGYAFYGASKLVTVNIPSSVTSIGRYAFEFCTSLKNINNTGSVKSIGNGAFYGCTALTAFPFNDGIETIGDYPFVNTDVKTVILPASVKSIGKYAFGYTYSNGGYDLVDNFMIRCYPNSAAEDFCNDYMLRYDYIFDYDKDENEENITITGYVGKESNVVIPSEMWGIKVTGIKEYAFNGSSVVNVTLPSSLTAVNRYAFYGASKLETINLPSTITSIGDYAFEFCVNLKTINSTGSVKTIGNGAFYGCTGLDKFPFNDGVKTIRPYAFTNTALTSVDIPESVTSLGDHAFGYDYASSTYTPVINFIIGGEIGSAAEKYATDNGFAFSPFLEYYVMYDNSAYITGYRGLKTELVIPSQIYGHSVSGIKDHAFENNETLTKVTIPDTVTYIGVEAFDCCEELSEVQFGKAVDTIDNYAFYACRKLQKIDLPDSMLFIGKCAFYDCKNLSSVSFGNSLMSLGKYAFENTPTLKGVTLPDTVETIEDYALGSTDHDGGNNDDYLPEFTITASKGSVGEKYANDNGLTFIDNSPEVEVTKIRLSSTALTLQKDKTAVLTATITPSDATDKTLTWYTSDKTVATVKDGTVTAVGKGTCTVYAKSSNGKKGSCTVTVTETAPMVNTSVINSDIVQIGDKVRIAAAASGGKSPYTYAYYYKRSTNASWKTLGTEWGTNSSVAFAPTAEAEYDIKVIVKDSEGVTTEKLFTVKAVKELELTNVSVVSREKINLGSAIPMIGKAVGGAGEPYTYSFYFKRSTNTAWKLLGEKFQTTASARFKPTATGTYDIRIDVKDSTGTIVKKFFTATVK